MKEWNEFLSELEYELGREIVKKWIPKLIRFDAANIYLEPSDSFQANWFEEHIRPKLKNLTNANNRPIKVHLILEKKTKEKKEEAPLSFHSEPLDPLNTLETFLSSEKNEVVFKLFQELPPFNPIYIYGPKGVGKTHLLMGIAHRLQKMGTRVFYVRAETFTEHVVQAIRLGQMQLFRKTYRDIDVLLIDGIHIFSKKAATQEEFFHTFNTLHTQGRKIFLSAQVAPSQLQEIEPRLVSRFEWGISLEVGKGPMAAILKQKGAQWNIILSEDLLQWLLHTFPTDPVMALQAWIFRAGKAPPTQQGGEKLLKDLIEKESENALTPEKIIKGIATFYGITTQDILGKSQTRGASTPRQIAMYFCRERLGLPFQKIGELFGRDHSTVMSSIKQTQKSIEDKTLNLGEFSFL